MEEAPSSGGHGEEESQPKNASQQNSTKQQQGRDYGPFVHHASLANSSTGGKAENQKGGRKDSLAREKKRANREESRAPPKTR